MASMVDSYRGAAAPGPLSGNQVTLKVRPEDLIIKAEAIEQNAGRIQANFENMNQAIKRTRNYWNGDAADLHRRRYDELVPEAEEMFRMLRQHAKNLQNIAQTYIGSEGKITSMSSQLPKNAIE